MSPILKRTLSYFLHYWKLIVLSAVCSAIVGGMDAGISYSRHTGEIINAV